jgi:hypothetical protein
VQYGNGVTAVEETPGDGQYAVFFNRSLVNCVVQAVSGFGDPSGSPVQSGADNITSVEMGSSNTGDDDHAVRVVSTDAGTLDDTSFMITAFC